MNSFNISPDEADVQVGMFEWNKAITPETIGTIGLGPCIGIAIYRPDSREGYIGHFVSPIDDSKKVEDMFSAAIDQCSTDGVQVWVRGGNISGGLEERELTKRGRTYIVDLLSKFCIAKADVLWNQDKNSIISLLLDTTEGRLVTECYDMKTNTTSFID